MLVFVCYKAAGESNSRKGGQASMTSGVETSHVKYNKTRKKRSTTTTTSKNENNSMHVTVHVDDIHF